MNKTLIHNLKFFSLSIALGIALGGGLMAVNAWTDAPPSPPAGNLGAPINTSTNGQAKAGGLVGNGVGSSNRTLYFGNHLSETAPARFWGDNGSAITFQSNSPTLSQLLMRNSGGGTYGRIYGSTGSDTVYHFGLLNSDGQWSYMDKDDVATYFYRNGSIKMTILENGLVGIGKTNPAYALDVVGGIHASTNIFASGNLIAGGNLTAASAKVNGLINCNTIDTDANGNLKCGTDASGGSHPLGGEYTRTCGNDCEARCNGGDVVVGVAAQGSDGYCGGHCVSTTVRCQDH